MKIIEVEKCVECPYLRIRPPEHYITPHEFCSAPFGKGIHNIETIPSWCPLPDAPGELESLQDKIQKIKNWCNAYPVEIFPEPDFEKAAKILKKNDMTLDAISASNMRHVLNGIVKIIET